MRHVKRISAGQKPAPATNATIITTKSGCKDVGPLESGTCKIAVKATGSYTVE